METTLQPFKSETLSGELGNWTRQEHSFAKLFTPDALKDREFQKMKLAEYDRLWLKYSGGVKTTDEKALMDMLRFQRRKMEKTLYPRILTRVFRKIVSAVKITTAKRLERSRERKQSQEAYNTIPLVNPLKESSPQQRPPGAGQRYGRDLGGRHKNDNNTRKGQSL